MKTLSLALMLLLLMAGAAPAFAQFAQYNSGQGYVCYACPVCGTVFSVTPEEAASANPYDLCPSCYMAYLFAFIQVPCQAVQNYDQSGANLPGYNQDNQLGSNQPGYNMPAEEGEDQKTTDTDNQQPIMSDPTRFNPKVVSEISEDETSEDEASESETPSEGKILMVLSPQDYQEDELNVPRDYFQSKGYEVILASKGVETATGMNGENVSVDVDIDNVDLSPYQAVIFVGGEGIYYLSLNEDPDYTGLAKKAASQNKLVGAICLGPWILADAGLLQGKQATAAETDYLKSKGAVISDLAVVQDGSIITANGPDAAREFAEAIVAALEGSYPSAMMAGAVTEEMDSALRVPWGILGPSHLHTRTLSRLPVNAPNVTTSMILP
jgi:protease I